jgi:hypothetical protein
MDEKLRHQVQALQEMSGDPETQQTLGKRLLEQVAAEIADEKRGREIAEPDVELVIHKGDLVPPQFRDRVETDAEGRAVDDFTVQALSLIIWLRIWIRIWVRIIFEAAVRDIPLQRFEEFTDRMTFEPEEMNLIRQLRQLSE